MTVCRCGGRHHRGDHSATYVVLQECFPAESTIHDGPSQAVPWTRRVGIVSSLSIAELLTELRCVLYEQCLTLLCIVSFLLFSNMSVLTGIQFPLFGMISNAFTGGENRKLTSVEQISAGFLGGAMSGFACAPMELVLIQQQKFGGSVFSTPSRLVSTYGASSMFRGFFTSCGREGIFTAG